ncbi:MAG: hypothetical protein U5J63_07135 [Fodinibius sp.]|nr:hypothetical protein [Fodinibius sp.]
MGCKITAADILFVKPTYVNRSGLEEIKADSLHLSYSGNAMDGLQSAINGTRFGHRHSIEANSKVLTISVPEDHNHKSHSQQVSIFRLLQMPKPRTSGSTVITSLDWIRSPGRPHNLSRTATVSSSKALAILQMPFLRVGPAAC